MRVKVHGHLWKKENLISKVADLGRSVSYIARPPVANERLSVNAQGQVIYKLKHLFRDGTTHVVMEPLAFIARLAALVPRPTPT